MCIILEKKHPHTYTQARSQGKIYLPFHCVICDKVETVLRINVIARISALITNNNKNNNNNNKCPFLNTVCNVKQNI